MSGLRLRAIVVTAIAALLAGTGVEWPGTDGRGASPAVGAPALRLVVNVPARELHVYRDGERIRTYPVAVGQPGHRTPAGLYRISRVVWNPWWHPPDRAWAAGQGPVPPGPANPMGRVKMYFLDLYYIHGTPNEASLGRAASHGCIRMANGDAIELARLVHEYGSPDVSPGDIAWLVSNPKETRTIALSRPVPVEVVYDAVTVRDGVLEIHRSGGAGSDAIVRERAIQALIRAGYDVTTLDEQGLAELVEEARGGRATAPVDALLEGRPVPAAE